MATKTENTAAVPAMLQTCESDPYSFEDMLYYRVALALIRSMMHQGGLSPDDYQNACKLLARRYGFPEKSILAEAA